MTKRLKLPKTCNFFDAIFIMFDWAAEQLFKTMVIFKCIVIVCDLKVVHKNSDYIWKEHTKLSLAHLCLSNFVYLYEYIVIRSKHFTIDNSECSWALPEISMVGFHFLCNRRRHPPSVGRHSAFQSFSMACRDHTHTGVSINIWIISYIYVDLEWTLLLLKVIRHSHTRSHYWKPSQTPIILWTPHQMVSPSPFSDHFMRKKPVTAPSVRSFPLYLQN